jgi:hypothetical protein
MGVLNDMTVAVDEKDLESDEGFEDNPIEGMLTLLLGPSAGLHFFVGLDVVTFFK